MSTSEILCPRCGTPFPPGRSQASVTCIVCGQLRPDLDMTLDDDDEEDLGAGFSAGLVGLGSAASSASSASPKTPAPPPTPPKIPYLSDAPAASSRPYVSLGEDFIQDDRPRRRRGEGPSLTELIGPVVLIVTPLAAGVVGALEMLALVDDFSLGSWYAVGTVLLMMLIGSLVAGLFAAWIGFTLRLRKAIILRAMFIAGAVVVGYFLMQEVPGRLQVRENAPPAISIPR